MLGFDNMSREALIERIEAIAGRKSCYLVIALEDGAVVRTYLKGPQPPWRASRIVGDMDVALYETTAPTFHEASARMRQVCEAPADGVPDMFPHVREHINAMLEGKR